MASLRRIAVTVDEIREGRFDWVLMEKDTESHEWKPIRRADSSAATYHEAMAEGLMALQAMVDDLDTGPRGGAAEKPPDEAPEQHGGKRFGFGNLRE